MFTSVLSILGLLGSLAELVGLGAVMHWKRRDEINGNLYARRKRPRTLPLIDRQAERLAGSPTKLQRQAAQRITSVIRFVVQCKAFEHVVLALVNPKSRLRQKTITKEVAVTL